MLHNKTKHRRNHSQHPAPVPPKKATKNKVNPYKKKKVPCLDSQLVHELLNKSSSKPIAKQVLI